MKFLSLNKFICAAAVAVGLVPAQTAEAKVRTAGEAAAVAAGTSGAHRAPAAARPRLVHTLAESGGTGQPALYVFNHGESGGYTIVSGDDRMPAVLAFADSGRFDSSAIPPAMEWWLDQYAAQAESFYRLDASQPDHPDLKPWKAPHMADSQPIGPLVTAKWNQSAPFNNRCPLKDGQRSVTGCVATATAMVVDYHRPTVNRSAGTVRSTFDGTTFNFYNESFDWDLMLDDYNNGYSSAQANAVATLMLACGVSVNMQYSPSESGAYTDFFVPYALTEYFGLDKGLRVVERKHTSSFNWDQMLYNEVSQGRPVIYSGSGDGGGHCFVCDGYRWQDAHYFHFNWGWGGSSDGWFLTSLLSPGTLGIGGGSGGGFSNGQSIIVGIQKPVEGSIPNRAVAIYQSNCDGFYASSTWRSSQLEFSIRMVSSYPRQLYYQLGVGVQGADSVNADYGPYVWYNNSQYSISACDDGSYGYATPKYNVDFANGDLPAGRYTLEPIIKIEGEKWKYIPQDLDAYATVTLVKHPDGSVEYTNNRYVYQPDLKVTFDDAGIMGMRRAGFDLDVLFSVENRIAIDFNKPLHLMAFRDDNPAEVASTRAFYAEQTVLVSYPGGTPKQMSIKLPVPRSTPEGRYKLRFFMEVMQSDGTAKMVPVSDIVAVDILPALPMDGKLSLVEIPYNLLQNTEAVVTVFNGTNANVNGYLLLNLSRAQLLMQQNLGRLELVPGGAHTFRFRVPHSDFATAGWFRQYLSLMGDDEEEKMIGYAQMVPYYNLDPDRGVYYGLSEDNSEATISMAANPTCYDGGHYTLPTVFSCTVPLGWDYEASTVKYGTATAPVTSMSPYAFASNHAVTDLHIPASLQAEANFANAEGIVNYWFESEQPRLSATPLPEGLPGATVYVPTGAYDDYLYRLLTTGVVKNDLESYPLFETASVYQIAEPNSVIEAGRQYVYKIQTEGSAPYRFNPAVEVVSSNPNVAAVTVNPFHTADGNSVEVVLDAKEAGSTLLTLTPHQYGASGSQLTVHVQAPTSSVDDLYADPDAPIEVYTTAGVRLPDITTLDRLEQLAPGIYIVRRGTATFRITR